MTDPIVLRRRRWFAGIVVLLTAIAIIVLNRSRVNYVGLTLFVVCVAASLFVESKLKPHTNRIIFFCLIWLLLLGMLLSLDFIIYGSISKSYEAIAASLLGTSGLNHFRRLQAPSNSSDL